MNISIIGIGRLGGALALALDKKGFEIETLVARDVEKTNKIVEFFKDKPKISPANDFSNVSSDVIIIATQDSEIEFIADALAGKITHKPIVLHTSGALSSEILKRLKAVGCRTGSIHPLVSISDARRGADRFANAFFCVEGDAEAVAAAETIVTELDGKSFAIATEYKTLYHASAVTASGHLVALLDAAIEMLMKCGLDKQNARTILLPLVKSTIENLEEQTTAAALTGTFARADVGTLGRHLEILREKVSPELLEIYLQLGLRSLHLAETQGADKENLMKMRGQISLAKTNLKC
jgi:predicted short-subunit dehydrogenase-like oxidoreductase (DUF2520 family)